MLKYISLLAIIINTLFAGIYFPLQKGNVWSYSSGLDPFCDGNLVISFIQKDTTVGNYTYADFTGMSVFGVKNARSDANKVYSYDFSTKTENVIFDFQAQPGDTVAKFNNSQRIIVALGSMQFMEVGTQYTNFVYSIKDSIGVVSFTHLNCPYSLTKAIIDGKQAYPTFVKQSENDLVPEQIILNQNYPNPFNSSTNIQFYIKSEQNVKIDILNCIGQQLSTLLNSNIVGGWHRLSWDANNFSSGIYFVKLQTFSSTMYRSAVLIK